MWLKFLFWKPIYSTAPMSFWMITEAAYFDVPNSVVLHSDVSSVVSAVGNNSRSTSTNSPWALSHHLDGEMEAVQLRCCSVTARSVCYIRYYLHVKGWDFYCLSVPFPAHFWFALDCYGHVTWPVCTSSQFSVPW